MKTLTEYLNEAMELDKTVLFTTDDMMDWEVWTPNDDLTEDNCKEITNAFYKKYPAGNSDEGEVAGCPVQCSYDKESVSFSCSFGEMNMNARIKVVREIVNLLTNTVYSVAGSKTEIRYMLNKI